MELELSGCNSRSGWAESSSEGMRGSGCVEV